MQHCNTCARRDEPHKIHNCCPILAAALDEYTSFQKASSLFYCNKWEVIRCKDEDAEKLR